MIALIIIDMQIGSFKPWTVRFDTGGVVERINKLSRFMRGIGNPVIFIQHDGSKENRFLPGTSDWKILEELEIKPEDKIISKETNDSFYKTDLLKTLEEYKIKKIIITGCATDFCVDTSIKSALSKDFDVMVAGDGHTTADRKYLNAKSVIDYFNWIWENSITVKNKIRVLTSEEILEQIKSNMENL